MLHGGRIVIHRHQRHIHLQWSGMLSKLTSKKYQDIPSLIPPTLVWGGFLCHPRNGNATTNHLKESPDWGILLIHRVIRCRTNLYIQTAGITSFQTAITYSIVPLYVNGRTGTRTAVQRYRHPIAQMQVGYPRTTELATLVIRRLVITIVAGPWTRRRCITGGTGVRRITWLVCTIRTCRCTTCTVCTRSTLGWTRRTCTGAIATGTDAGTVRRRIRSRRTILTRTTSCTSTGTVIIHCLARTVISCCTCCKAGRCRR